MKDKNKTNVQLIKELTEMRKQLAEKEKSELNHLKNEKVLKSSEEKLNIIFEAAPDAIFLSDLKGTISDGNKAVEELLGYKIEDLIGKNYLKLKLLSPKELSKAAKIIAQSLLGKKTGPEEFIMNRKNGATVVAEISTHPVKIGSKKYILGIARNITERKIAEDEIKQAVINWQTTFDAIDDIVMLLKPDHEIIAVNKAGIKALGKTQEEIIGQKCYKLVHNTDAPIEDCPCEASLKTKTKCQGEYSQFNLIYDLISYPIYDDKNEIKGLTHIVKDITRRKRTEQIQSVLYDITNAVSTTDNLEELICFIQEKLGAVIDTTNFFVALYDHKTDTLSLPFFTDEKDKITAIPAGKTLTKYVIKTRKPLLASQKTIKKLINSGDIELFGTIAKKWLGVPLKSEGIITGVLAIQSYTDEFAYDDSDLEMLEFMASQISMSINRKKSEENLIAALIKAEESDQLKSAFLANMSHEIRTPMNAILGFSNLLSTAETKTQKQEFIKIINSNGENLLKIIHDIIDISQIEAGIINIENQECNINRIMDNVLDIYKIKDKIKNNKIEINLKKEFSDNRANILSDKIRIQQILINLMENAYKCTNKGEIEFGYTLKQYENNTDFLEFFVKDTGIGIQETNQKVIFDRFMQEDISSTRTIGGTGLGLTIVKSIVKVFGGDIWVKSLVGKGSTFYFTIPYKTVEIIITSDKVIVDWSNKKILIAEDVDDSYLIIKNILNKTNANIIRARNGIDAIEMCRTDKQIDIVLMDIRMPKKDGYEATKEIKNFRPDLPIIAQTAYAIRGDKEKAFTAGCDDHLSKPINSKILIEKINVWLAKKK